MKKAGKRKIIKRSISKPGQARVQTASSRKSMIHKTASALKSKYSAFVSLKKLDSSPEKGRNKPGEIKTKRTSGSAIKDEGKDSSEAARAVVNEKIKELSAKSGDSEENSPEKKTEVSQSKDSNVSPEGKKLKQEKYIKSDIVDKLANKIQAIVSEEEQESNEIQSVALNDSKGDEPDNGDNGNAENGTESNKIDLDKVDTDKSEKGSNKNGSNESDKRDGTENVVSDSSEKTILDEAVIADEDEEKKDSAEPIEKELSPEDENDSNEVASSETAVSGQDSEDVKDDSKTSDAVSKSISESPASKEEYRKKLQSTIQNCKAKLGMEGEDALSDVSVDSSDSEDESSSSESDEDNDDSSDRISSEKSEENSQDSHLCQYLEDSKTSENIEKNGNENEEEKTSIELEKAESATDTSEVVSKVKETEKGGKCSGETTEEAASVQDTISDTDKEDSESRSIVSSSRESTENTVSPQTEDETNKETHKTESAMDTSEVVSDQSKQIVSDQSNQSADDDIVKKSDNDSTKKTDLHDVGDRNIAKTSGDEEQDQTSNTNEVTVESQPKDTNSEPTMEVSDLKDKKSNETISDLKKVPTDPRNNSKEDYEKGQSDLITETDKNHKDTTENEEDSISKACKVLDAYGTETDNDKGPKARTISPFENTGMLMEVDNMSDTDSDTGRLQIDLEADTSSPVVTHSSKPTKDSPNKDKEMKHKDKIKSPVKKIKKTTPTKTALKEKILKNKNKPKESGLKDSDIVLVADGLDSSPEAGVKKVKRKKKNIKECRQDLTQTLR